VFSADGEILVTEGENHTLHVWDGVTGEPRSELLHSSAIEGIEFAPVGHQLASYTDDHIGHLWNTDTGETIAALEGHTDAINGIAFTPDGTILATYSDDHSVRLWSATDGHLLFVLEGHINAVTDVTFASDGQVLASTSGGNLLSPSDNEIRLWDVTTGIQLAELPGDANNIRHTTFSPDGATLVALSANFVKVYGVPTEARPISSVPGIIVPISVNLRAAPSLDAEIIGYVNSGTVLVGGRDETGQFVYLIDYEGWVWSDPTYIDLGSVAIEDLPVIEP
jgi:WD40 repeat protein